MSVATEIQNLETNIRGAYAKVSEKGGTLPNNKNTENLADSIDTIPTGGGEFIGVPREISQDGLFQIPTVMEEFTIPSNATSLGTYAFYNALRGCQSLVSVDMGTITSISGNYALGGAFNGCSNLANLNLSNLKTIESGTNSGCYQMCYNCTSLTAIDLGKLESINGTGGFLDAFYGCSNLSSVNLSSLSSIPAGSALKTAFRNCTSLKSLSFPALTANSFGTNTNQFNNMLQGCTNVTIHFPASVRSTIQSWSDVTAKFGAAGSTNIRYDL